LSELPPKVVEILMDYLNRDKYLIVQAIAKSINKDNRDTVTSYLDWAMSRVEWLIITLSWNKNVPKLKKEDDPITDAEAMMKNQLK